jgi:DNA invertase Pin-like site-specific DNA recombinase
MPADLQSTRTQENTIMAAISYTRVSTNDQADSGAGLAAQRAAIEVFASRQGLTITAAHEDAGISGAAGLEDRPGLMAAVAQLRRGDVLLIAKRDRLGRDQMAVLMIERAVAKRGAAVMSADGIGNADDPGSVFMKQIVDAAAVYERGLIKARTKAAMAAKRSAGHRIGEVPFGWQLADDGRLVEHEAEQLVLQRIKECRAAGMSLRAIAAILMKAGVATKKGRTTWYAETVKSILDRAALAV